MNEPEVWVDYDHPPMPRNYEKCEACGSTRTFVHPCDLTARLRAFARDCVTHGDMTPMAEQQLHHILDNDAARSRLT